MQGNKVLTGNVIILTHVRPIHKTTGVPGPAQGAGLGLSPEPGGSRCCCGKDSFPWLSGRGSVLFVKRGKKNIFFKRTSPRSLWSPCLVSEAYCKSPSSDQGVLQAICPVQERNTALSGDLCLHLSFLAKRALLWP